MTLTTGYASTSTDAFTLSGTTPITVTKISGNDLITWNNTTKRLDIAAGLPVGVYEVKLRASNSSSSYHTFIFTLTVANPVYYLDLPTSFVGGKVTVKTSNSNPYLAEEGDIVTLTVIPDAGYALDEITVYMLDGSGNTVKTVVIPLNRSGNTFTFTMPGHHVSIVVTFRSTTGVEEIGRPQGSPLRIYVQNGVLYVNGLTTGQTWSVYNTRGVLVYQGIVPDGATAGARHTLTLRGRGIYIVTSGARTIKIVY
jgi:hypothetical protein